MITTSITIHGRPEKRTEILQTVTEMKYQLGKNTKCRQVRAYQDIDNEDTLLFVKDWQSDDDLDTYFSSVLFKALLGLNPLLREQLEIQLLTEVRKVKPEERAPLSRIKTDKKEESHEKDIQA